MYSYADQLPAGTLLQDFDIAIVGAGAAGLAMAKRLNRTSKRVLVLASGSPSDRGRPTERRQSIYRGTMGAFLQKVDPIFPERSRLHMYGGTTNHFGFWSRPLDEADLKPRPGYRAAGWLISSGELARYYADAHHFGRFGPYNYDDMPFWERTLYARCFSPQAGDTLTGDTLTGAIMHAQYDEALHDFQVQFGEELRASDNVTVLFNAHLLRLHMTDDNAHVESLECATIEDGRAGRRFTVRAARYALAMGGIENVRLLKLSGDVGDNASGHLGRGFMVHPLLTHAARVRFGQPVATEIRSFFRDQQVRLQPPQSEGGSYTHVSAPLVNPEHIFDYNIFNAWGVLVPTAETLDAEQIGNFRIILRFEGKDDEAIVNLNWEQVPNENSLITLDPAQVDPVFGQPVSHVDWRMLDIDKRTAVRAFALCEAYLRQHGAVSWEWLTDVSGGAEDWTFPPHEGALATGDHHMGALRMSARPEDGIVNADSRLHNVDNLYIAGCAVFPTGGFANPTLTIVALALRLADHLGA
jgi:choline dehydrogenase-like flavoprotein